MKNLSLFVTLSLLTIMGTCTIVKANSAEDNLGQSQDPNSVILSQENTNEKEVPELMTDKEVPELMTDEEVTTPVTDEEVTTPVTE